MSIRITLAPGYHGDCDCGKGLGVHEVFCEFHLTEDEKQDYIRLGMTPPRGVWHYICDDCFAKRDEGA